MTPRTLLALCFAVLAVARVAHAEDAAERASRRYYERGQKLFNLQKFEKALEQFQKAFDAKPFPGFLFNIGQCHRNLGDYDAAIFSFKRYLRLDPEADNREQVEELIEELEQKKAEADTERLRLGKRRKRDREPEPEQPPRERSDGTPVYGKWWFWTGVAAVAAAGGVGLYFATKSDGGPPSTDLGHIDYPK